MRFERVDELLGRRLQGEEAAPLGMRLTAFARGVAVYEMPVRADVAPGVITALAQEAMNAAALSALRDDELPGERIGVRDLTARFEHPVRVGDAPSLRAEAIVVRASSSLRVEAVVLCGDTRVASLECECERPGVPA